MTEDVKEVPTRKPRTKKATAPLAAPSESPESQPLKVIQVETVLEAAPIGLDMATFKGSFRTKTGAVVTYL